MYINQIEWFFSTKELCRTVYELKNCDELRINPGFALNEDWSFAAYKGGSEPGVLQYTYLLRKKNGADFYAVSVTVNDTRNNVDEAKVSELTVRLLSMIKSGKM